MRFCTSSKLGQLKGVCQLLRDAYVGSRVEYCKYVYSSTLLRIYMESYLTL